MFRHFINVFSVQLILFIDLFIVTNTWHKFSCGTEQDYMPGSMSQKSLIWVERFVCNSDFRNEILLKFAKTKVG